MKNLIVKAKTGLTNARRKTDRMIIAAGTALGATVADALPVWAANDAKTMGNKFFKYLFQFTTFGGIILIIAGVASLIKPIVAMISGDHIQPNELGKGAGLLIGGIIAVAIKPLVKGITGVDPETNNLLNFS